ncbi:TonB-dependent receptor [bacterium]|nr:TonB-dependent receptor [bacterium]
MRYRFAVIILIPLIFTILQGIAAADSTATGDRDEIHLCNLSETADWISVLPGIWTRSLGSPGQTANLRVQGGELSQSRIFLDGHPLIDPFSRMTDLNLIPLESIGGIERHTPGGSIESAEGIHIETREIPGQKPYTRFVYRNHVFRGATGMDMEHIDVTFGQHVTRKIRFASGISNRKIAEEFPGLTSKPRLLRAKIRYSPSPAVRIDYAAYNAVLENDLPYPVRMPSDTLILQSPVRKQNRTDHLGDIRVDWKGMRNRFSVTHSSATHELKDLALSARSVFPVRMTRFQWTQDPDSLPVNWGTTYQDEALELTGSSGASQHFWEIFLGCKQNWHERIGSNAGIRWIRISRRSEWDGFARIQWKVRSQIGFWTSLDRDLKRPSLGEIRGVPFLPVPFDRADRFYLLDPSRPLLPNGALRPEKTDRLQIGLDWKPSIPLKISLLAFMRKTRGLIVLEASGESLIHRNGPGQQVTGLEAGAEARVFGLKAEGTLNYTKAVDADNSPLYERPSFWGCASISWTRPFFENDLVVCTGLSGRFSTGYWILTGSSLNDVRAAWVAQSSVLDYRTTLVFLKYARFTLAVDNFLNLEVSPYPGLFLPGRTFRLEVDWELFD